MTMRRMFMMAAGAVLPVAVIALIFDNQWVVDAIRESDFRYDEGVGPLVSWAQTLSWRLYPADGMEWSYVLISDFAVLLFFVLLAVLVVGGARVIDPNRGPLGALIIGWWAAILAGAISGLVYGPLAQWTLDFPSGSRIIFSSISQGAVAGTVFGWLAGLGALGGLAISGSRAGARQPQGSQLQYPQRPPFAPQQPGMPMQQPGVPQQQMPQQPMQQHMQQQMPPGMPQQPMQQPHPSAVPYVPPQGQPQQQPQWGAAPVPQQPGAPAPQQPGAAVPQQPGTPVPQQFGAPPVPPVPPQPAQPVPAPAAAEQSEPETAADDPETSDPGVSDPGVSDSGSGSGAEPEPPADTPEDDDLDLADRTIVDRGRTED